MQRQVHIDRVVRELFVESQGQSQVSARIFFRSHINNLATCFQIMFDNKETRKHNHTVSENNTQSTTLTQGADSQRRNVQVPDDVWKDVRVLAVKTNRSLAEVVTAALSEYVKAA